MAPISELEAANLWEASGEGDLPVVRQMMKSGKYSPISIDHNGYNPLMASLSWGHIDLFDFLVKNLTGADPCNRTLSEICAVEEKMLIRLSDGTEDPYDSKDDATKEIHLRHKAAHQRAAEAAEQAAAGGNKTKMEANCTKNCEQHETTKPSTTPTSTSSASSSNQDEEPVVSGEKKNEAASTSTCSFSNGAIPATKKVAEESKGTFAATTGTVSAAQSASCSATKTAAVADAEKTPTTRTTPTPACVAETTENAASTLSSSSGSANKANPNDDEKNDKSAASSSTSSDVNEDDMLDDLVDEQEGGWERDVLSVDVQEDLHDFIRVLKRLRQIDEDIKADEKKRTLDETRSEIVAVALTAADMEGGNEQTRKNILNRLKAYKADPEKTNFEGLTAFDMSREHDFESAAWFFVAHGKEAPKEPTLQDADITEDDWGEEEDDEMDVVDGNIELH
ncbi:unnamed protein product [Amoebophrya sp. A25]|nr:unnamed protein product [Amoebophrya sp. A25]|eukprot:GSA25T00006008001.1